MAMEKAMDSAAHRLTLLLLALVAYTAVTIAFAFGERPELGVGHFYYLPIALVALAGGPILGACAGVLGVALYSLAFFLNSSVPAHLTGEAAAIRLIAFVGIGVLIGAFSQRNRALVAELSRLANRDSVTGLPNTRAFEVAIDRRLDLGEPFLLLIADVDELREINVAGRGHGDDALRRLADRLVTAKRADDDVARVGGDEFAILGALDGDDGRRLAVSLEQHLASGGDSVTFGWASFPHDGDNALALYRVADERLYARKVARGFRRNAEPGLPPPTN
jgi:diguanylate cyclase (GGDEF)-like protein